MFDLGFLAILALWSFATGSLILRRLRQDVEGNLDRWSLALPLGLGTLALGTLALGEIGRLDRGAVTCFLVGMIFVSGPGLIEEFRRFRLNMDRPSLDWLDRVFLGCLVATLLGTLFSALAPVTDGDALCYHLQVPKRFLEKGSMLFDPDLHETVYPLLTEMLYSVGLLYRGPVSCRLIQWGLGLVFALNVSALGRPFLGPKAWWGGTIALLVPAVSNGMSAPLNDVGLAAFGTAAIHAWVRYRDAASLRSAILLGVLTGLALGVKYPALVLAGLIGLTIGSGLITRSFFRLAAVGSGPVHWFASRSARKLARSLVDRWVDDGLEATGAANNNRRRRRRWIHVVAFGLTAWVVGGGWYLRALVHTGNPVHPFFKETFGGAGLDEVLAPEKRPLDATAWNLVSALGPLTLQPGRFDSFSHQFGPVFLLFLPAIFLERPSRRLLWLLALGYGFLAICLTQRQSMRFLLIAVGPLSVGVAWLAKTWWERRSFPSRAILALLSLVLMFESTLALGRARSSLGVVLGFESEASYLARREPTFLVGRWIDQNLDANSRIIGQDHRGFYIPRDYVMELAHRRRTGLGARGESALDVRDILIHEGFTHVLMCPPDPINAVEFDPTLSRILEPWLATRLPLYRQTLKDADGVARAYEIYRLTDEPLLAHSRTGRGRP